MPISLMTKEVSQYCTPLMFVRERENKKHFEAFCREAFGAVFSWDCPRRHRFCPIVCEFVKDMVMFAGSVHFVPFVAIRGNPEFTPLLARIHDDWLGCLK